MRVPKEEQPMTHPDGGLLQIMPKVGGKPFRCECTCNVFHHPDKTKPNLYQCNSCEARYIGE